MSSDLANFVAPQNLLATENSVHRQIQVIRLADVMPAAISWLIPDRIALGKLSLISGDPGLGKSILTLHIAATVTNGGRWPDGTKAPQGDVLLLSAEDSAADTIQPRFDAAGGNLKRMYLVGMVKCPKQNGRERSFSIERDVDELDRLLTDNKEFRLVVIDPISAYLHGVDSHNNSDVRAILAPLASLAEKHSVAILAVTHLNKGSAKAIYRPIGSIAFTASARASYVVCKDPDNASRRLFLPVKNNLGNDSTGFAYTIATAANGAPRIEWEPGLVQADDVEAAMDKPERGSALAEAITFLSDLLQTKGPMPANKVQVEARKAGHAEATLRRAKDSLRARSVKQLGSGKWVWILPDTHNSQPEDLERLEHLERDGGENSTKCTKLLPDLQKQGVQV